MEQDSCVKVWCEAVEANAASFTMDHSPMVMLLEDEPLIAMDVESTLRDAGFDVVTFMSCEDADVWLESNLPDFAIVDIELRDGPCTEVVLCLKHAKIPFVIHSGDHPGIHAGTPFEHSIWIGKPAASDCLVEAVRAWASSGGADHGPILHA